MTVQDMQVSEMVSRYTKRERYSKIRDFYLKMVEALESKNGMLLNNFFLIISGDDDEVEMREAYLKFADYLADNYSEEVLQRAAAYYWVASDFKALLCRSYGDDVRKALASINSKREDLFKNYSDSSASTAWLAYVEGKADELMPLLMKGVGDANYRHGFSMRDKDPDPLPCFNDYARQALIQILRNLGSNG